MGHLPPLEKIKFGFSGLTWLDFKVSKEFQESVVVHIFSQPGLTAVDDFLAPKVEQQFKYKLHCLYYKGKSIRTVSCPFLLMLVY